VSGNWYGFQVIDNTGSKYALSPSGARTLLTPVSATPSTQTLKDSQANLYVFSVDPSTGNLYTSTTSGLRYYSTGFPSTTSGLPTKITDSLGNIYTVYSDPSGNQYITYTDSNGNYYINSLGNKVYLPSTNSSSSSSTIPTFLLTDSLGNKYTLSNSSVRVPLTFVSANTNSQTYKDAEGNLYTFSYDPSSNIYTSANPNAGTSQTKYYSTGFPTTTSGTPSSITDNLGTTYAIYSDPSGNKYLTYTAANGPYYYNSTGNKLSLGNVGSVTVSPVYIFIDGSANRYTLNSTGDRNYLSPLSSSSAPTVSTPEV
jgi:YD repeat-containing protein